MGVAESSGDVAFSQVSSWQYESLPLKWTPTHTQIQMVQIETAIVRRTNAVYTVVCPPAVVAANQNNIKTTKYTLWTFLPLNLYLQFHKAYNLYFLIGCFSVIGGYSSISTTSLVSPLLIVLAFSAAKEAIEDLVLYF